MSKIVKLDPVTRIEGHLAVSVEVENQKVISAQCAGEMFRGFETILRGRDPLDAQQITQRICGVCPISHGITSCLAQEQAYGLRIPKNGRLMRNLIQAANYLQSHIVHFYQLSALDFVDIVAITGYNGADPQLKALRGWVEEQLGSKNIYPAAPFLPRYEGTYLKDPQANFMAIKHYLEALRMRQVAHQGVALFGGKVPHATALVPGGMTEKVTPNKIAAMKSYLSELRTFITESYIPDVLAVAKAFPDYFTVGKGVGNYMAYGVFFENDDCSERLFPSGVLSDGALEALDASKITEQVGCSYFSSASDLHPSKGASVAAPDKEGKAYSWLKAPRYGGRPMEVGPLARVLIAYTAGKTPGLNALVNSVLSTLGAGPSALNSVLGRHATRAIEAKIIADRALEWVEELHPDAPTAAELHIPQTGSGAGMWEAPRGALGHWIEISGQRISNYQCVVPSTWNCSPRDDMGAPGPVEVALEGTPIADNDHPIEAARVVRSFDPCLACAVH